MTPNHYWPILGAVGAGVLASLILAHHVEAASFRPVPMTLPRQRWIEPVELEETPV